MQTNTSVLMVPLLFSPEEVVSMFSKKDFYISPHLTAEQFFRVVSVYFKWALCQSRQRRFRIIFKYGFFLHDRALTWIVWTPSAFTDSDLWKCSWAYAVISMTNHICFSCSVARSIQHRFSVLALTHRDFSIFSDNIQNIIWDIQSLCILISEH